MKAVGLSTPRSRLAQALAIAQCVVQDAVLFGLWLLISWGVDSFAVYVKSQGFVNWAADVFKWVSTIGTLGLSAMFIATDLVKAATGLGKAVRAFQGR